MADVAKTLQTRESATAASVEGQTLLVFAKLMEGGQEDEETCKDLDELTKLLTDDADAQQNDKSHQSICQVIDIDCVDTVLGYLDVRQSEKVRGHATLTTSAYLKAAGDKGAGMLSTFFFDRIKRGTYDDYIVAFCVAASTFPLVPDFASDLFLSEGFIGSLGPLMRRKWKSRKVETACLEMLNAACMSTPCRDAIQKYCTEWLEEIVEQDPGDVVRTMSTDPTLQSEGGSITMRRHSEAIQHLAAVILAKLRAVTSSRNAAGVTESRQSRIEPAVTSIEDLSSLFTKMIMSGEDHGTKHSVEGLAYASLQPRVKESIASDPELLKKLVKTLSDASPRSPTTYGGLSIFVNLTRYQTTMTDEQKKMSQLKAYADAAGKLGGPDPLNDDEHVAARCQAVFDAGIVPVLVTHTKHGSPGSLGLAIAIIHSLAVTKSMRGQLAQQGAVKLLLIAWAALPETEDTARRIAAQALARILISINPAHLFGGNRANAINTAIRPLTFIIPPDPAAEIRDLLPTFEGLMALTNLASLDDDEVRQEIIRTTWQHTEEQLLSSNHLVSKAAVELVCNLVQVSEGVALYAEDTPQAKNRLHVLLALADAEDEGTRSAAGGALAALTNYEPVVKAILARERGAKVVLGMAVDDSEDVRHRGVYAILSIVSTEGETGSRAKQAIKEENGVEVLKECLKKSRRPEVLQVTVQALKILLDQK